MEARNLTLVGIATWAVVVISGVVWQIQPHVLLSRAGAVWAGCMVAFLLAFIGATRSGCFLGRKRTFIALQTVAVLIATAIVSISGMATQLVLLVVVAGEMGAFPLRQSLTWITFQTAIIGVFAIPHGTRAIPIVLSYLAFQLFALFAVRTAHREADARQALAEAHAQLKVTSGLLEMSSRAEERLRIARDLHDLVGHHLTALSLNLEVASHVASGAASEPIAKSRAITKDLLADVRAVVSRLREHEPVDLTASLSALRDVIVRPSLHVDVEGPPVSDRATAEVALRGVQEIVTNAVRHSGAQNLWVTLSSSDHRLDIRAHDDGAGADRIVFGNGLRGIQERVEQLHGSFEVSSQRGHGFAVHMVLPVGDV